VEVVEEQEKAIVKKSDRIRGIGNRLQSRKRVLVKSRSIWGLQVMRKWRDSLFIIL